MIAWLNPLALATLAAVAAPVLVHLLRRQRATRVLLPTLRFVPRTSPQSVRLRRLSDTGLLLLRAGIVACGALALAAPVLLTDARRAAWGERIVRAVIVDGDAGDSALAETVRAEVSASSLSRQEHTRELSPAVRRAVNWLQQSLPARREIVIVSPFVHGSLTEADVAAVPAGIGLRFVRINDRRPPEPRRGRFVGADGVGTFEASLDADSTAVRFEPAASVAFAGLVIHARTGDADAVERLRRVLARAGVADTDVARPVIVRFRGGAAFASTVAADPASRAAALRLVQDPAIAALPVTITASGAELRVDADVEAASFEAATIVRSALEARIDPVRAAAYEVASIPDASLQAWSRGAAMPSREDWLRSDRSDARWLWLAALLLLAVEGLVRRRRQPQFREVAADAA
jgi:hypothetical protein